MGEEEGIPYVKKTVPSDLTTSALRQWVNLYCGGGSHVEIEASRSETPGQPWETKYSAWERS